MKVTLYTKEGCELCQEAQETLRRLQKTIDFTIDLVYIEEDPEAYSRYRDRVPVIAIDGVEAASVPLDERCLRALLLPSARRP